MNNINEIGDTPKGQYALGRVAGRAVEEKITEKRANSVEKMCAI